MSTVRGHGIVTQIKVIKPLNYITINFVISNNLKEGDSNMGLKSKLLKYAEHSLNVMLIGSHGIGKTTVVKNVAEQLGVKFKYYSSSTLDPFAELIGIPVPDKDKGTIEFYRPKDLEDAEFIFFDELNRAHPRVLNAVLEIIQFKSINGIPLKNLKMVWAAINPPGGDYQVEDLDPALQDRFHCYIKMHANMNVEVLKESMDEDLARCLKMWWDEDLGDEQREILTPRRMEYVGVMIQLGMGYRDAIPQGRSTSFPLPDLDRRLKIMREGEQEDFIINKENILQKKDILIERIASDKKCSIKIGQIMKKFNENELFECRDLLETLPTELVMRVGQRKFAMKQRQVCNLFDINGIDIKEYPKIAKAFNFVEKT